MQTQVGGAFRCSLLMDTVLTSPAVQDLAFAACVREQGAGAVEYCQQFQNSIQVAQRRGRFEWNPCAPSIQGPRRVA